MKIDDMMLRGSPAGPARLDAGDISAIKEESRRVKAAKDFESLIIGQLIDSMKQTIGESGLLEESGSEQMQSMFWMHLAGDIADKGGFGLWRDIYRSVYGSEPAPAAGNTGKLDSSI